MAPSEAPETAGFGNCPECAYVSTGTAGICFACANETIEPLPDERCMICDGLLKGEQPIAELRAQLIDIPSAARVVRRKRHRGTPSPSAPHTAVRA